MCRIIHRFKYRNKTFSAGELTVGDYMLSMRDPEYFIEKILLEFNKKAPDLSKREADAFVRILFNNGAEVDLSSQKKDKSESQKDFHVLLGMFMKATGQGFNDVMAMPLEIFRKMLDDLDVISGNKEYDPQRNSSAPDREKMREMFG